MEYDVVVRGGTVIDGLGNPRHRADVGVVGDTIVTIDRITEKGRCEVDAEGHFVTPGFIDGHTHLDAQVNWDPLGTSVCWHGVTTVVMGNCGFTLAPCSAAQQDLAIRSLERAEDISRYAIQAGVDWSWTTFAEYLDTIERIPKGINYSGYIGHSALRAFVMGERAYQERAGEDDLAAMCAELEAAMRAGAMGFSTSLSYHHLTFDDSPVASRVADWTEVRNLVGVLTRVGAGIFQLAPDRSVDPDAQKDFRQRLIALGIESGRPLTFMCGGDPVLLAGIDDIAHHGGEVVGQVNVRDFQNILSFKARLPFDKLPFWHEVRSRPLEAQRMALLELAVREKLVAEAMSADYGTVVGAEARPPRYDDLRVLDSPEGPYDSVGALARDLGTTPVDVMIDLALKSDFDQFFCQSITPTAPEWILAALRHPRTVIAASDSGAHVSQIMDSAIPSYFLAHWVRHEEAFSWEEAIHMLTGRPAGIWGFEDRGALRSGMRADLVVFDPDRIGPGMPTVDNDLPAQGVRLKQKATGIRATVVNGQLLMVDGEHTGVLPGRLLRGPLGRA